MAAAATLLGAALALTGCSRPAGEGYFPLEAGHHWTYRVTSEWENNTQEREEFTLRTEGVEDLALSGRAWRRRSDLGVDYWLKSDDSGIYRVASKHDLEEDPRRDAQPRYVLKTPLQVGSQWRADTTAYLLRRRADFPPEIRHSHPAVPMNYSIEAVGETVQTAAGQFGDCLRVKGVAVLRLFADPVVGWKDMPLTTLEWYCKGVGLVRVQRSEPANSTFLTGGTQTLELISWR
jgi:hypothetical protein